MSEDTLILLVVIGIAAYWCFTRGPCQSQSSGTITQLTAPVIPSTGFGSC
jgi:hypothetical protein